MKISLGILFLIFALIPVACKDASNENTSVSEASKAEVSKLLQELNLNTVQANIQEISAKKANTLKFESGAKLEIPENAFVDAQGNDITEKVIIQFRKFDNPIDIIIADIPMQYDSAGTNYMFESAAMCEILAFDESGQPVFMKNGKEIGVTLNSHHESNRFNLYRLNPKTKIWEFKGKDKAVKIDTSASNTKDIIKPKESKPDKQFFNIVLNDKKRFPDYELFDSIKFELKNPDNDIGKQTAKYWIDFNISSNKNGTYTVTFLNKTEEISYIGNPVFDGKDYQTAMQNYREQRREAISSQDSRRRFYAKKGAIERSFKIDKLGTWNCDAAVLQNFTEKLNLEFIDKSTDMPEQVFCAYAIWRKYKSNRRFFCYMKTQVYLDKLSAKDPNELLIFFADGNYVYFSERKVIKMLESQGDGVQKIYIHPKNTTDFEPDLPYSEITEEEKNIKQADLTDDPKSKINILDDLRVYPNPTRGIVNIKGFPILSNIVVSDIAGRTINELNSVDQSRAQIDLTNQPAGVYLITVISKDKRKSERIVLQK